MQGRLLPKYQNRYQAHPVGYWQDEFEIANSLNIDCLEFIFDHNEALINPLLTDHGKEEILKLSQSSNVKVLSVCADYFMNEPMHSDNFEIARKSSSVLRKLILNCSDIGIRDIVIPCVDQASLKSTSAIERFIKNIKPITKLLEKVGVNLSLETDLSPIKFINLINSINSKHIKINYDTGNSAYMGYDVIEELSIYGDKISDIHIKDRLYKGSSVILGTGSVNFDNFFEILKKINYCGPFILQAYRDDEGLEVFKAQYEWILNKIKKFYEN